MITNKVTWVVIWESLERFAVHVSFRLYALHCIQCSFIKRVIGKFLKVVYRVDKHSPRRRIEKNFVSCQNSISDFLWITVTTGHELQELQILTLFYPCKENSYTVSAPLPLCWELQLSVLNFENGRSGNLKNSYHIYLHGEDAMLLV